jgi:hypothetical protein
MTFIKEFNALSLEAQNALLAAMIGDRPILANLEISGNVERIGPIDGWLVINNFINKQDGPAVIKRFSK